MCMFDESICGCTLKTSSKIIGYLNLVVHLIFLILSIIALIAALFNMIKDMTPEDREFISSLSLSQLLISFVCLIATILMLYGVHNDRPVFLIPWLLVQILLILLLFTKATVQYMKDEKQIIYLLTMIIAVVCLYLMLVVYNFYKQLTPPPST